MQGQISLAKQSAYALGSIAACNLSVFESSLYRMLKIAQMGQLQNSFST